MKKIIVLLFVCLMICLTACQTVSGISTPDTPKETQTVKLGTVFTASLPQNMEIKSIKSNQAGIPDGLLAQFETHECVLYFRDATAFDFDPQTEWKQKSSDSSWMKTFMLEWLDSDTNSHNAEILNFSQQSVLDYQAFILEYAPSPTSETRSVLSVMYIGDDLFFITKTTAQATGEDLPNFISNIFNSLQAI